MDMGSVVVTFRLDNQTNRILRMRASENERTLSGEIRLAVKRHLENAEMVVEDGQEKSKSSHE